VESFVVVVRDVFSHQAASFFKAERRLRPDAFTFDALMPPLNFAVRLRVVWRRFDVGHAAQSDELLEVFRDELRAVVGDNSRPGVRIFVLRPLDDYLHVSLRHSFSNVPVDDVPAASVENAAQVVKGGADVDVRHVDVPVFMRL